MNTTARLPPRTPSEECRDRRLCAGDDPGGCAVQGKADSGIDDRILFRFWDDYDQPLTLTGDGETFTFADRAFIRIGKREVEVWGSVQAMKLDVPGKRSRRLNGKTVPCRFRDGQLQFDAAGQ